MTIHVFIDDERMPPKSWDKDTVLIVRTAEDAIKAIDAFWGNIDTISFDHDLGEFLVGTGYDVINHIEAKICGDDATMPCKNFVVHSMNPIGAQRIKTTIKTIERYMSGVDN